MAPSTGLRRWFDHAPGRAVIWKNGAVCTGLVRSDRERGLDTTLGSLRRVRRAIAGPPTTLYRHVMGVRA